jgi:N-carbamoyl-L-amino-acid hydrolase
MFTQSLAGLSHNKAEDTRIEDLRLAVQAFDLLASKTLNWISAQQSKDSL